MMNRRQVLQALAVMGAAINLPQQATAVQVDESWAAMQREPWVFEVDDHGTLREAGQRDPEVWRDVVGYIPLSDSMARAALMREVESCGPLAREFDKLAASELPDEDRDDWDGFGLELLAQAGPDEMRRYVALIREWLDEPIDSQVLADFPRLWGSQGHTLSFFEGLDRDITRNLGVVIVEGDQPGSSYFAAELRNSVDDANRVAAELQMPFRFRKDSAR